MNKYLIGSKNKLIATNNDLKEDKKRLQQTIDILQSICDKK